MLRISLIGNLGADAEVRESRKGVPIVDFRVAVNQVHLAPDGTRQENTVWFSVRVMGRQTEYAQRLTRGSRVFVAGRLDVRHYRSRDDQPRTSFDVWSDEVQVLTSPAAGARTPSSLPEEPDIEPDDDITL
jgi:single-strand DNA-binding protein